MFISILFSLIFHHLQCANLHATLFYQHRIHSHYHSPATQRKLVWDTKTKYKNRNSRASTKSTLHRLRIFLIKPTAPYLSAVLSPQPSLTLSERKALLSPSRNAIPFSGFSMTLSGKAPLSIMYWTVI